MYSEEETKRLVEASVEVGTNLMPYVNKELLDSLYLIQRNFRIIKYHDIRPERYWHGDMEEYHSLIMLVADGYPNKDVLLEMAEKPTNGALQNICSHFYQTIEVMFGHVQAYKGYDVLKPTEYMLHLHPDARGKYYVYPREFWAHMGTQHISPAFLVIDESELSALPALMKKRCGII
jgi:hypothetical protein